MTKVINYVSGRCGSGKTHRAIKELGVLVAKGESVIYATNTIALLAQTAANLKAQNTNNVLLVSDLSNRSVVQTITKALNAAQTKPVVFLCTTQSLIRAASKLNIKYTIFVDEGLMVYNFYTNTGFATPQEALAVATLIGVEPQGQVDLSASNYLLSDEEKQLKADCKSPIFKVEVNLSDARLEVVTYLDINAFADKFKSITLLAAYYEDTIQYAAIKAAGCQQNELNWGLPQAHVTSGTIEVYWVLENKEWRTFSINKLEENSIGEEVHPQSLEGLAANFESLCAFDPNVDDKFISVKGIGGEGEPMPVFSHGMNSYDNVDHVMDLHAQMPFPTLSEFFKVHFKMTQEQIRKSYYQYDRYQSALRCSLRSKDDKNHKFCFGDKGTAEYFASKIDPTVKIKTMKLPLKLGPLPIDKVGREPRVDKVSEGKQEKKNRSNNRRRIKEIDPTCIGKDLEQVLNKARDYRRNLAEEDQSTRLTKATLSKLISETKQDP